MAEKKKVVLVMNCAAQEIVRFLRRSPVFCRQYSIEAFPNYTDTSSAEKIASVQSSIATADVLIVQNVQAIEWLRTDNLSKHMPKHCHLIRLVFWRFDGFWPIASKRRTESFWYVSDEFPDAVNFHEYIGADIKESEIQDKFQIEVEKFRVTDSASDLSMMSFFEANYKRYNLFSDAWHPSAYFYWHVTKWILRQIDIDDSIPMLARNGINKDRYRLVFNRVFDVLDLSFDARLVRFFDYHVSRQTWYEFSRYAEGRLFGTNVKEALELFEQWRNQDIYPKISANLALGMPASQSSRSEFSRPGDPHQAVNGTVSGRFSMHTMVQQQPWWQVDLGDFREIRKIIVWNGDGGDPSIRQQAAPMVISISVDGAVWTELARANFPIGGAAGGSPLVLDFTDSVVTRFVKISIDGFVPLRLDEVQVFCDVIALNGFSGIEQPRKLK